MKTKHIAHKLTQQNVLKRVLWAYGIYIILSLVAFAIGYLLLPEGALRGSAIAIWGEVAAQQTSFWSKFLATIGFNLGIVSLIGIVVTRVGFRGRQRKSKSKAGVISGSLAKR